MNAKFQFVCRAVGMLLLAAGVVKMTVDAMRSFTFDEIPSHLVGPFNSVAMVSSFHVSFEGILPTAVGCLLIYFGFRAPRKPTQ